MSVAWDPLASSAGIALSNGGLTATDTAGVPWSTVFSNTPIPRGQFIYFEITVTNAHANGVWLDGWLCGIANKSHALANAIGFDTDSAAYATSGSDHFFFVMRYYNNSVGPLCANQLNQGDILCIALDTAHMEIWGRSCAAKNDWNSLFNVPDAPSYNIGGFDISGISGELFLAFSSRYINQVATLNASGPFVCGPPPGYTALLACPGMWPPTTLIPPPSSVLALDFGCSQPTPPIFPTLPAGFPVKVSPVMDTVIGTTKSLREMRVPLQQYPLWDIELTFMELRDQTQNQVPYGPFLLFEQFEALVETWLGMYGQSGIFAFDAPWDDSRANQVIGIIAAGQTVFPVFRTWGSGGIATSTPVGMINTVTSVEINSTVVDPSLYSVGRYNIYFKNPPLAGGTMTITFTFYYLCRFVEDEQDFEEFAKNRWTVPSLKFRSVYWP